MTSFLGQKRALLSNSPFSRAPCICLQPSSSTRPGDVVCCWLHQTPRSGHVRQTLDRRIAHACSKLAPTHTWPPSSIHKSISSIARTATLIKKRNSDSLSLSATTRKSRCEPEICSGCVPLVVPLLLHDCQHEKNLHSVNGLV